MFFGDFSSKNKPLKALTDFFLLEREPSTRQVRGRGMLKKFDERLFWMVFNLMCKWLVGILSP